MASLSIFSKILERVTKSGTLRQNTDQALSWFREKVSKLKDEGAKQQQPSESNSSMPPFLGSLYLMEYTAKTYPERLTYYDHYPLILVLSLTPNGFLGLNFHYLPHK